MTKVRLTFLFLMTKQKKCVARIFLMAAVAYTWAARIGLMCSTSRQLVSRQAMAGKRLRAS
jgi:hypothetical protein